MKNYILIALICTGIGFSCADDTKVSGLPAFPANISLSTSTVYAVGVGGDVGVKIYFGQGNLLTSLKMDLIDANGTTVQTKTFSGGTYNPFEENDFTWLNADSGLGNLASGNYTLKVTASGKGGVSSVQSYGLLVVPLPTSCTPSGSEIQFVVIAPTPSDPSATIGMVGAFSGWGGNPDVTLTKVVDGVYCGVATIPTDASGCNNCYKFRLDSDWGQQELTSSCQNIAGGNRLNTATAGQTVVCTVEKWQTSSCHP